MKYKHLAPNARKTSEILEAVAQARGCTTPETVAEFLNPLPPIHNEITDLPDYKVARDRIELAIKTNEKIVIYGDYDCDGITSLAQMVRFFKAAGANVGWFIPHRMSEEYGLTDAGIERCLEEQNPGLVICVDCASTANRQILLLAENGVDTIVIDHHGIMGELNSNIGALAHLNPKAFVKNCASAERLSKLSAAGLVYLFTESLAAELNVTTWDRTAGLILGGLGTLVDVMPLVAVNRALVKWSIHFASQDEELIRIPGLAALKEAAKSRDISAYTYGFEWGPRINATGRLDAATASVKLLLSDSVADAMQYALFCNSQNEERKTEQENILNEAMAQAEAIVAKNPRTKILVLTGKNWHTGIVGIVASNIKDRFQRPAFVCGWLEDENSAWKGSGRSIEGFDMGQVVLAAVAGGYLQKGGGHAMAAGIRIAPESLEDFTLMVNQACACEIEDFHTVHEVIGSAEALSEDSWLNLLNRLEPFGSGNPRPQLIVKSANLVYAPKEKKRQKDGVVFAVSAGFKRPVASKNSGLAFYDWFDVEKARKIWSVNKSYDMVLTLKKTVKHDGATSKTYINWNVENAVAV